MRRDEPRRRPKGWRGLVFGGDGFDWCVRHEHHVIEGRLCREVLLVKRSTRQGSTLRLEFGDGPDHNAGYPQAGVVWVSGGGPSANLNQPRMARAAIEVAREHGWDPDGRQHVTALDGWALLEAIVDRYDLLGRT